MEIRGAPISCTWAMPVIRLMTVGPSVEKQTPGFPISFPYVAAMNAAAYSYLVTISLILEVLSEFEQVKVFFVWKSENMFKDFFFKLGNKKDLKLS